MLKIPNLTDAEVVFGDVKHLPPYKDIPDEFKRRSNPFARIASKLFFEGGRMSEFGLTPKDGVDLTQANRALQAVLRSFEPKHEHKAAGAAFMLSEWFDLDPAKAEAA